MFYLAQAVFSYSFFLLSHLFCLNKYMADMNMPKSIYNGDAKKLKNYLAPPYTKRVLHWWYYM